MIEKREVRETLIKIFKEISLASEEEFLGDQPLNDIYDSMTQIEIYNEIDDAYAIEAEFEEVAKLRTFNEILDFVFERVSSLPSPSPSSPEQ
jgi:acyl carrier protein